MSLLIETEWGAWLGELTLLTALLRLALAALCGAVVGVEREAHGRAAGLRTHMMVAIGAALSTILGVFIVRVMGVSWADPMRIAAQVVSGIGFLGAGTILLKKGNQQITGLTTAAGLWVTAMIGLAIGAGFYEGALISALLVSLTFTLISKVEGLMNSKRQRVFFYMEIDSVDAVRELTKTLSETMDAREIQVTAPRSGTAGNVGIEALIRIPKRVSVEGKLEKLESLDHVLFALQL